MTRARRPEADRPAEPSGSVFWAEHLWTGDGEVRHGVVVEVAGDRIATVETDVDVPPAGSVALPGLTLPGLVDAHSHAFHRALRGRTQVGSGSFWTWRDVMYSVAGRLTPENYEALAAAVFTEMVLAGVTTVGEFHYVHHTVDGTPHDDPIAMSRALARAAATAGIRLTLLDTCYLMGGFTPAPASDSSADASADTSSDDEPDVEPVHVQRGVALVSPRRDRGELALGHRPHGVHGGADHHGRAGQGVADGRRPSGPGRAGPVAEAELRGGQRHVHGLHVGLVVGRGVGRGVGSRRGRESAHEVAGVEQRQADARGGGRPGQRP